MITLQNYKVVITMLCQTREDGVSSRHTLVPFLRKLFIAFLDFLQNILNDQTGNGKSENAVVWATVPLVCTLAVCQSFST